MTAIAHDAPARQAPASRTATGLLLAVVSALLLQAAHALPAPPVPVTVRARDGTTPLSAEQLASFKPFTQFARAAYCPVDKLMNWTCGGTSVALAVSHPHCTDTQGRGLRCAARLQTYNLRRRWERCPVLWVHQPFYVPRTTVLIPATDFVGHWPASNTVIVSHQGTDPTQV